MSVATDVVITLIDGTDKAMVTVSNGPDKHEGTIMATVNDYLYKLAIEAHGRTRN